MNKITLTLTPAQVEFVLRGSQALSDACLPHSQEDVLLKLMELGYDDFLRKYTVRTKTQPSRGLHVVK